MRRFPTGMIQSLVVTGLLAGLIGAACSETPVEDEVVSIGTEIGQTAPNFEVYAMDGTKVTLADYRGKPLFVNFWGWWCPPCIREAELLMNIAYKYEGRIDFLFVGVNTFYKDEEPLDPKEFAEGFGPGLERFKTGLQNRNLVRPSDEAEKTIRIKWPISRRGTLRSSSTI